MKIEINLLPGAKKKRGAGAGFSMPNIGALVTQIKDPLLAGAIGSVVVGLSVVGTIWFLEGGKVAALDPQVLQARNEARRFRSMIAEKGRTQVLRDSLVLELDAIRGIDGDRFVWPHIMDEVSRALPDFTWIVSLDAIVAQDLVLDDGSIVSAPVQFNIDGRTSDIQAFTRFLTRLESSPWLTDIRTGGTQSVIESDRTVTSFQITGTYQVADSSFIRTVPVDQILSGGG